MAPPPGRLGSVLKTPVQVRLDDDELALIDGFAAELSQQSYGAAFSRAESLKIAAVAWLKERRTHRASALDEPAMEALATYADKLAEQMATERAAHAEVPPGPPGARVVVPPPEAGEVLGQLAAEVAAAPHETFTTSKAVPPAPKVTPQQQRVLDAAPLATTDPEGFSRKDIMQVTGLSEQAVDSALFKLHQRGHIVRVSAGHYVRSA